MKKSKKTNKIFHPEPSFIIFLILSNIVLLTYSLGYKNALDFIKYFSYLYSTYGLVVVCANIGRFFGYLKNIIIGTKTFTNLKNFLYRNKYIKNYFQNKRFSNLINLYISAIINFIFIFIKFKDGIVYKSFWFISLAIYYIFLTGIKFFLLRNLKQNNDLLFEYKVYKISGFFMLIMNLSLILIILQMINKNVATVYPVNVIYFSAMYSFYLIISAVVNMIKYRKYKSPVLSAVKSINLFTSCVSILMLQTTMIATFSKDDVNLMKQFNTITGSVVSVIILFMAVFMILNGRRMVKKLSYTDK